MDELPKYINCKSKTMIHCDFYMHNLCPETCAYALDIKRLGIGAITELPSKLEENADNSTKTQ